MKLPRVSILGLIAVVAGLAMVFTALRTASDLWFSAVYTFTVIALLVAVIAAKFGARSQRAFWFGFAVFGWGFFLLGMGPWTEPFASSFNTIRVMDVELGGLNRHLMTSKLVYTTIQFLRKSTDDIGDIDKITANTLGISFLLVTLALALCGGLVGAWIRRQRVQGRPGPSSRVVTSLVIFLGLGFSVVASRDGSPRSSVAFFPDDVPNQAEGEIRKFAKGGYSEKLETMSEPSLLAISRQDPTARIYRLQFLPCFSHPMCVRIEKTADGARLHVKVLDGFGGYDAGQVAIDRVVLLDQDQWMNLERLSESISLWSLPIKIAEEPGTDSNSYTIEVIKEGKYHVVDRQAPDANFLKLHNYMIELTGLKGV